MAKSTGGFKDPFKKWEDGSKRGVASVLSDVTSDIRRVEKAQQRLSNLRAEVNRSATSAEKALFTRLAAEAATDLKEALKSSKQTSRLAQDLKLLQSEAILKMSALREYVANGALTKQQQEDLTGIKKHLEAVFKATGKSRRKLGPTGLLDLEDTLAAIQIEQQGLSQELKDKFEEQEQRLNQLREQQAQANAFLEQHNKNLRALGGRVLGALGKGAMSVADKIGYGPLTAGNVIRGAAAISRGAIGAAKFGARVYKGDTYLQKYLEARRISKGINVKENDVRTGENLVEKIKELGNSNSFFQKRLLNEFEKQGRKKDGTSSFLGKILVGVSSLVSGLVAKIAGIFGEGGLISSILSSIKNLIPSSLLPKVAIGGAGAKAAIPGAALATGVLGAVAAGGVAATGIAASILKASPQLRTATQENPMLGAMSGDTAFAGAIMDASSMTPPVNSVNPLSVIKNVFTGAVDKVKAFISPKPGVDVQGLNPSVKTNAAGMAEEYFNATGRKLTMNSGKRSTEKQAQLYATLPAGRAAKPGSSLHEYGMAFDIDPGQANELDKLGLLSKYGFTRPIKGEPWHVQPKGITLAAAKAGIFSADAPINQGYRASATPVSQSVSSAAMTEAPLVSNAGGAPEQSRPGVSKGTTGTGGVSVNDIPTVDQSDQALVAMNLGVFA